MSYTALQKMREYNKKRFGADVGPFEPDKFFATDGFDLKSAALRFIHDRCEGLQFDEKKESEFETGKFTGSSIGKDQIPYNMQMDVNRLCLERELEHFIDSGVAEDAYNVYYCYLEIFFGHYGKSKKMIELLSEFESNGSSLLMKHRDHYSHSVYVFALGLAIYDTNENYRKAFQTFYDLSDDCKAAVVFLEYWGLSSLFHDIGYPFELPFEQVMAYYEVDRKNRKIDAPMIAYKDVSVLTKISEKAQEKLNKIYGRSFDDTCDLFAQEINTKLYEHYKYKKDMREVLNTKPTNPEKFTYYMDHAWFSANRLFQELTNPIVTVIKHEGQEDERIEDYSILNRMTEKHIDALTAIILHNSLYKFVVAGYYKDCDKQIRMEWHPLAYLLMLCDELQCWDRTAYGRNSRTELHPMAADFDFNNNAIAVTYFYDAKEIEKIRQFKVDYADWKNGKLAEEPTLKAYSGMWEKDNSFLTDILHIVDTAQIPLTVDTSLREVDRKAKHTYLSVSNFLHLYDFAVALHNRYSTDTGNAADATVKMETEFENLSLEYQLSNINQAKHFSHLLHVIDCFYTDRPVDFEMVEKFTPRQTAAIAPLEHRRWIHEHREMGWTYGDLYETCALPEIPDDPDGKKKDKIRKAYREQLRMHKLAMDDFPTDREIEMHYHDLPTSEQGKDIKPFNKMLELIKLYDGLRIYKLN